MEQGEVGTKDGVERVRYLDQVMADIDAEVRRRRASGDLPAGLESDLDKLFLEFSPVGLHGNEHRDDRLYKMLALVDSSAAVDVAAPVASDRAAGRHVKRLISKSIGWYIRFVINQVVQFAWAVSRILHVLVEHVEELETAVAAMDDPKLPASLAPAVDLADGWWTARAVAALSGIKGRVLHADCGTGALVDSLLAAGVDAYGVDPDEALLEAALDRGLDVRAESMLDHLEVVGDEDLAATVLTGSIQWLPPRQREDLLDLLGRKVVSDGIVVVHSCTPESWAAGKSRLVSDLAPSRPLHAETWAHLLADRGFRQVDLAFGGDDSRLEPVPSSSADAAAINAAIEVLNDRLLGPGEFLLVAIRQR